MGAIVVTLRHSLSLAPWTLRDPLHCYHVPSYLFPIPLYFSFLHFSFLLFLQSTWNGAQTRKRGVPPIYAKKLNTCSIECAADHHMVNEATK